MLRLGGHSGWFVSRVCALLLTTHSMSQLTGSMCVRLWFCALFFYFMLEWLFNCCCFTALLTKNPSRQRESGDIGSHCDGDISPIRQSAGVQLVFFSVCFSLDLAWNTLIIIIVYCATWAWASTHIYTCMTLQAFARLIPFESDPVGHGHMYGYWIYTNWRTGGRGVRRLWACQRIRASRLEWKRE